jgi:hypothetical protein
MPCLVGLLMLSVFFLEIGTDAATENEFGETPAQMACIVGESELEELLLHSAG